MKIDMHVHSKHSSRPTQWILKKIGCPESFMEPEDVYRLARRRGMDRVTISDHNCIDGALEIAHLDGVFISEEVTAHFPEDGCKVHVLVWDINEAIHEDLQRIRRNIYDLASYLNQAGLHHACAHPLYGVNDKLTLDHLEKLLLLFPVFECNGTRDGLQNTILKEILASLDQGTMERMAERHDMEPLGERPWVKGLSGGSDDHSGIYVARMYTEAEAEDLGAFLAAIRQCAAEPRGRYSTPRTMAHNLYSIGYQYFRDKCALDRFVNKDRFLKYLDRMLTAESPDDTSWSTRFQALVHRSGILKKRRVEEPRELHSVLRNKAEEIFYADPFLMTTGRHGLPETARCEDHWYEFANRTANHSLALYADKILDKASKANIFDLFQTVASAGALYTALTPYFVAYGLFTKDRAFCRSARDHFRRSETARPKRFKMAHFTDTFFETNGVAKTLQEQVRMARMSRKDYIVVTCDRGHGDIGPGVKNFTPIGMFDLPEYPDLKLFYPPFLEMLSYVYENDFTHLHAATPGPIGLMALLVARVLKLPISGTYHTALPQYALHLTGDDAMEQLTWRFMTWFYNQMDKVYSPSQAIVDELRGQGVNPDKLLVYPRGVDIRRFTPIKRNGFFDRYSLNGHPKLLYVGRVSKEKNLHLLERMYVDLCNAGIKADLVVVGDGPYRREMETNLEGTGCVFTGMLDGDDLAQVYASSDLFIFPSTTDTFGKVVLEAQASGLPVVVTDKGGPRENVIPGETGLIVDGEGHEPLVQAVRSLLADPGKLKDMGSKARASMESRSFEKAFDKAWQMYMDN